MTQQTKDDKHQPPQPAVDQDLANKQKQKAAELEIAGRHKNDGKNDHAGHQKPR